MTVWPLHQIIFFTEFITIITERPGVTLDTVYQELANVIPPGWQYPDITCARIAIDGKEFKTPNYRETAWKQASDIIIDGQRIGAVEVYYLEEKPECDEGPFVKEERNLINGITNQLGSFIQRKRAEEALKESEENYRSIFETANDAIFVHDMKTGVILDVNQAACELHKLTKEEILSLPLEELSVGESPYSQKEVTQWVPKAIKEGPQLFEWLGKKKDGELMWEEVHLKKTVIGGKDRILAIVRDITERKKMQVQLIQSEKLSAVGMMAAGIAHELLNPMMGILNFAQFCLRHTDKDDPRYSVLQDIERETERCTETVRNLLTFSRMEKEGEEGYQKERFALIIKRVVKLLTYRIRQEKVRLTWHVAEGTPATWLRVNSMQQVLLNLINNAMDALKESRQKEIQIEVQQEGDSLRVTVADSGCGIPPEKLENIFDPFFTTKPVGQGTGLGLTISRGIIQDHGGEITCQSKPDACITFNILLPIENRKEAA